MVGVSGVWSWCAGGTPLRSQDLLTLVLFWRERGWGGSLACAVALGVEVGRGSLAAPLPWPLQYCAVSTSRLRRGGRGRRQERGCGVWAALLLGLSR